MATAMSLRMNQNMTLDSKGLFISFEGGEGAGKSTLIERLAEEIKAQGRAVVITREPGGTALGDQLRQWLLHSKTELDPMAELLLFLASRVQHLQEIILPAVNAGKIVLCDRFNDSSVAYQGYARGLGADNVKELWKFVGGGVQPDMTFFLAIDPSVGLARASRRTGSSDRIEAEKMDFHERVQQGFKEIAKSEPERFITLEASERQEIVFANAWHFVQHKIWT